MLKFSNENLTNLSFEEYYRLNGLNDSLESCEQYLEYGGLFDSYVINNYTSMDNYIKNAIIENIVAYCGDTFERDVIAVIVYTILYKAVCDSTIRSIPVYNGDFLTLVEFLELFNLDTGYVMEASDINEVAMILEEAGIIVKIQNLRVKCEHRTYVVNPSLSYQLTKCIYKLDSVDKHLMGYLFESACVCLIHSRKPDAFCLYYAEGRKAGRDFEIDIILMDKSYSHNKSVWLYRCKFSENTKLPADASLVSDTIDNLLADCEIIERRVIYNGEPKTENVNGRSVIYDKPTEIINSIPGLKALNVF